MGSGASAAEPEDEDARATLAGNAEARSRLAAMSQWLQGDRRENGEDGRRAGFGSRALTGRDLLTGSSFSLTGEAKAGGLVSLWGPGGAVALQRA